MIFKHIYLTHRWDRTGITNRYKRWPLYSIFIIKGFRTIVLIFIDISSTFRSICPPAFFRCMSNSGTFTELRTTSFIKSTGVACSDSVSHNRVQVLSIPELLLAGSQEWTCKPPDDCLLREPTHNTDTLCVLLDNSDRIFGTYKLNVLTRLGLLLLCMIFLPVLTFRFFLYSCNEWVTTFFRGYSERIINFADWVSCAKYFELQDLWNRTYDLLL